MTLLRSEGSGEVSTGFYNGAISTSARWDNASDNYLYVDKGANGDRQKFTLSWWMKLGTIDTDGDPDGTIYCSGFSGGGASQGGAQIIFTHQRLNFSHQTNNSYDWSLLSARHFSDPSGWYHICYAVDTTQSTASNRIKFYVNGVQETTFDTEQYPNQNDSLKFNNQQERIGTWDDSGSRYLDFDGYFADWNLIDGQQLDPTSFGETKNGIFIPKDTSSLTFGTKGWRLQFKENGVGSGSSSTVGADTSGNGFHFTSSGFTADDCAIPDCPELNFCTLNPAWRDVTANTLSQGNTKIVTSTAGRSFVAASFVIKQNTGKWWWEYRVSGNAAGMGVARVNSGATQNGAYESVTSTSTSTGTTDYYYGENNWGAYNHNIVHNGSSVVSLSGSASYAEVYGVLLDTDASPPNLAFYVGGTAVGNVDLDSGYDFIPIAGDGSGGTTRTLDINFGQNPTFNGEETAGTNTDANGLGLFTQSVPSGAKCLCSSNIPELDIGPLSSAGSANENFSTVLYSGDGTSSNAITGVGFQPDWVWLKALSTTSHGLHDSSRVLSGAEEVWYTDKTDAANTGGAYLSSFDSDGFTVNNNTSGNADGVTHVAWSWKVAGGVTSSNGNGSITSTTQVNTKAGISIVTWTGNQTNGASVGHGLGVLPELIIIKNRDSAQGSVVNVNLTAKYRMNFNANAGDYGDFTYYMGTQTTDNIVFNNAHVAWNGNGDKMVAYVMHSVPGYSQMDTYTGNGNADGSFIFTGFRPNFIMVKRTNSTGHWMIFDKERQYNGQGGQYIFANEAYNQGNDTTLSFDFFCNGFKPRGTDSNNNTSNSTYFYMAFGDQPFKFCNAK